MQNKTVWCAVRFISAMKCSDRHSKLNIQILFIVLKLQTYVK